MTTSARGRNVPVTAATKKTSVVQNSLERLAIGQRKQPRCARLGLFEGFRDAAKFVAIFGTQHVGGVIRKTGENGNLVALFGPVPRQFGNSGCGSAHLRRKILRHVKNFHVSSGTA